MIEQIEIVEKRLAETLSGMIKFQTVKSKSDKNVVKMYAVQEYLKMRYPNVFKSLEIKSFNSSLLIKYKGTSDEKSVVFISRVEVGVSSSMWSMPLFDGVINDGYIHGKGAIYSKGILCAQFECFEQLLKTNYQPTRDIYIILLAKQDDLSQITQYLKSNTNGVYIAFDEGGAVVYDMLKNCKKPLALIATSERKKVRFLLSAKSDNKYSAMEKISLAISKSSGKIFDKVVISKEFLSLAQKLASDMSFVTKAMYKRGVFIKKYLIKNRMLKRILLPTLNYSFCDEKTIEKCGVAVYADMSMTLYHNQEKAIEDYIACVQKFGVNVDIVEKYPVTINQSTESQGYKYISDIISKQYEGVDVIPFVKSGQIDYSCFEGLSDNVIRFAPFRLSLAEYIKRDVVDEKISGENLVKATQFYIKVISQIDCENTI